MATIAASPFVSQAEVPPPLNPFITIDSAANEKSHLRYSYLWKTAAIVSAVAFIALAVGSMIFATLFAESYLPVVSLLTVYPGMPLSLIPFNACWIKGMKHATASKQEGEIKILFSKITEQEVPDPQLKPIFARYKWTVLEARKKEVQAKELLTSLSEPRVGSIDFDKDRGQFNQLTKQRLRHYELREEAAFLHLNAAFYLHVMRNPRETRQITDFLTPIRISLAARQLAANFSDDTSNALIKTPTGRLYTVADILNRAGVLSQEIFNP